MLSLGGRFGYHDQGQTANTQISIMDFGGTQLIFEVRGLKSDEYLHEKVGNIAHLEGGTIVQGKFYRKGSDEGEPLSRLGITAEATRGPGKGHFGNFIAAVRSRKAEDLNADILTGHHSATLCHLANISYRLGSEVPFNQASGAFGDNKNAAETLARMEEHLTRNGVPTNGLKYRVGRTLSFDSSTESFVGDPRRTACSPAPTGHLSWYPTGPHDSNANECRPPGWLARKNCEATRFETWNAVLPSGDKVLQNQLWPSEGHAIHILAFDACRKATDNLADHAQKSRMLIGFVVAVGSRLVDQGADSWVVKTDGTVDPKVIYVLYRSPT